MESSTLSSNKIIAILRQIMLFCLIFIVTVIFILILWPLYYYLDKKKITLEMDWRKARQKITKLIVYNKLMWSLVEDEPVLIMWSVPDTIHASWFFCILFCFIYFFKIKKKKKKKKKEIKKKKKKRLNLNHHHSSSMLSGLVGEWRL
jgi:hypothetical protein